MTKNTAYQNLILGTLRGKVETSPLSRDAIDFRNHSLTNLPRRRNLPGSNIRAGGPVSGLRGIGSIFQTTLGPGSTPAPTSTSSNGLFTRVATKTSAGGTSLLPVGNASGVYASAALAAFALAEAAAQLKVNIGAVKQLAQQAQEQFDARSRDVPFYLPSSALDLLDSGVKNLQTSKANVAGFLSEAQSRLQTLQSYGDAKDAPALIAKMADQLGKLDGWVTSVGALADAVRSGAPKAEVLAVADKIEKPGPSIVLIVGGVVVLGVLAFFALR